MSGNTSGSSFDYMHAAFLTAGIQMKMQASANESASLSSLPIDPISLPVSLARSPGQKRKKESASESATQSGSEGSQRQRLNEMSHRQWLMAQPVFWTQKCPFHHGSRMMPATSGGLKCSRCGLLVREPTEEKGRQIKRSYSEPVLHRSVRRLWG